MAGFFNALDKGLTQLSQSPVGMAGLGLLMMPSQSFEPINPWEYAAQGMQAGVQNRQRAQALAAAQERARREEEFTKMRYMLQAQQYQEDVLKRTEAQRRAQEQERNMAAYLDTLPPDQRILAQTLGKDFARMQAETMLKPPGQTSMPTSIAEYERAQQDPRFAQFLRERRAPQQAPSRPMSPADVARLQGPEGAPLPFGITPEEARGMGATIKPEPTTPRLSSADMAKATAKYQSAQTLKRQVAQAREAFNTARQEMASTGRVGGLVAVTPSAQKFDAAIDAMRSTVSGLTRTPGVGAMSDYETRLDQAKMPSRANYDEVTEQKLNELEALADGVLSGYGEMLGPQAQAPRPQAPRAAQGKDSWTTLPNGVRVRRKQ